MSCPQCKSSLEDEDGLLICTQCGSCQESTHYAASQEEGSQSYNTKGVHQLQLGVATGRYDLQISTSSVSRSFGKWRNLIATGSVALKMSRVSRARATELFERAFTTSLYIRRQRESSKRGMCAACLHVVCREESLAVSVANVCGAVQASKPAYSKAMKDLRRTLEVELPHKDQLDQQSVSICLKKHNVHGQGPRLEETTLQILALAKDCQIHVGCIPEPLIIAASFIAWQRESDKGFKSRYNEFVSSESGALIKKSSMMRVNEMRCMLHSMLSKVPWLDSSRVPEGEAVKYLEEIVKHHDSLKLTASLSDSEDDNNKTDQFQPKRYSARNPPPNVPLQRTDLPSSSGGRDMDRPYLDEDDIPDSEMDKYIH